MVITLMVNSACNLRCGHCYLPPGLKNIILSKRMVDWVFDSGEITHVTLAGMEPLLNRQVCGVSEYVGRQCKKRGIPFSLITNGMTLGRDFAQPVIDLVCETGGTMDVSLDGGPETYDRPNGNYKQIVGALKRVMCERQNLQVCILNTLTKGLGSDRVDDIMRVLDDIPDIHRVIFSLYVDTERVDVKSPDPKTITVEDSMRVLKNAPRFMEEQRAVLLVDEFVCRAEKISMQEILGQASGLNFPLRGVNGKSEFVGKLIVSGDPISEGTLRIHPKNDGTVIVLSPWDALHTANYSRYGMSCDGARLFTDIATEIVRKYKTRFAK